MKMNDNTRDLLANLNESQREAVEYCEGPSLVIAGAGSGKTRVLTYKVAYLIKLGLEPYNILALTFTNKAAKEMKERIAALVGREKANHLYMGTFHSVFSRILRAEAEHVQYNPNFTIYDETDSRSLLKSIIKGFELDEKVYKPAVVQGIISMAKNHLITAEDYANDRAALERDRETGKPALGQIYAAYEARCRQANAMDFDDLLLNTYQLLKNNEDIRAKYAERFQYLLVDEYQDTNYVQVSIVQLLADKHRHVCVVGDDYQSIYSFRGANIDNILDFKNKFQEAKLFKLERNYRSTQFIVQAANSLMKHNERQIPKDVYSREDEGHKIAYKPCYSDREEAMLVVKEIQRLRRSDGLSFDDFAILYRTNAQSRSFEDELRKNDVRYKIYGGMSFYQRKEIKDIIAYFRMVANTDDEEAFRRIINYPTRGIGSTTLLKIVNCAQQNKVSLWKVVKSPDVYGLDISKSVSSKLSDFVMLITDFIKQLAKVDAYELGKEIIKMSGISADLYKSKEPEDLARQENLEEFLSAMQTFVIENREQGRGEETYLTDFLQEVALYSDQDSDDDDAPKVTLMTIHAAKGLEFPIVFIVGMEENIFPIPMSLGSKRELEEERRLFYVAITRAEKRCIITNAKNRFRYGSLQFDNPSRFLQDIDKRYIDTDDTNFSSFASKTVGTGWDRREIADDFRDFNPYSRNRDASSWKQNYNQRKDKWQNSKPVASQFRADLKSKVTRPRGYEQAVDPLSSRTKSRLLSEGGNFRKLSTALANGGRSNSSSTSASDGENAMQSNHGGIYEGATIEHQRFGIGIVLKIEGVGENVKATVEFRNTGTKQLLLKFAKYKVL